VAGWPDLVFLASFRYRDIADTKDLQGQEKVTALPLTGKYADLLYSGDAWELRGYTSRFAARRAIVMHAINRGWSFEDCRRDFLNQAHDGSKFWTKHEDGRKLTKAQSEKRVRDDFQSCNAYVTQHPTYGHNAEVRQEISVLITRLEMRHWSRRTGRTDRSVLLGVLRRMCEIGSDRINFSARDAALAAGLASPATAAKALGRLVSDGWLERTPSAGFGLAAEYKCAVTERLSRDVGVAQREIGDDAQKTNPDHEAWLHFGKAARDIYECLTGEPKSVREIITGAKVARSTAYDNLEKLKVEGMAVKTADGGWVIGPMTPDDLVYSYGWVGDNSKTQQRQDRVITDRIAQSLKCHLTVEDTSELETQTTAELLV
jgi:hypothetical protein